MTDHVDPTVDPDDPGLVLPPAARPPAEVAREQVAAQLVEEALANGVALVGPNGLLASLTKRVLELGLDVEMTEHLSYEKHAPEGRDGGNSRNGTRSKKVLTDIGPIDIEVSRDRDGTFEPATTRKRQRRLEGVDTMVLSLSAKGLTTGEISAHLVEVYGTEVSKETISKITDAILEEMSGWLARPSDRVYPVIFIDAIHVKVRDGQVADRAFLCVIGVTVDGRRDILGIWPSPASEGAKFWLNVLTEVKNRGVGDVCIVVCDGLKGLSEAINTCWPLAVVQTCVLHLIRGSFRYAARQHWDQMARDMRPIYTAVNEAQAKERFVQFNEKWGSRYPAVRQLWENAWSEFVPFLDYDQEVRRVIYSTVTNPPRTDQRRDQATRQHRGHLPERRRDPSPRHRRARRGPRQLGRRRTPLPLRGVDGRDRQARHRRRGGADRTSPGGGAAG